MKRIVAIIIVLFLVVCNATANELYFVDVLRVDKGYSQRFNNAINNLNPEIIAFLGKNHKIDLSSFTISDDQKSYRAAAGNHSIFVYGIKENNNILGRIRSPFVLDYFSIITVVNFESDEMLREYMEEFIVLSYAAVLASDKSFTTKDVDAILFEKLDAKKILEGQESEQIVTHKGNKYIVSSSKNTLLPVVAIVELKLFPNI